ncbi:MFS transporter [Cognatishimia activa]|uniref:MFS transporter n=1 Tax=Cognatishimia activa TaxID=1715691 RepID=UPI00223270C5|nr:MFS transporter [Cognatishimia activa]
MPQDRPVSPFLLILILWGAGLGASMQFAKVTVSFPALQEIYEGSDTALGLLLSSISVLGVLLGLVAGLLVASYGFRRMLMWALFLGATLSAVQTLLPELKVFLLTRLLEGLSHLAIVVAAPTLMALVAPANWRNLAMTLWSAFFGVGYALTAAIGPVLINSFGSAALFGAHAIYLLIFAILVMLFLPKGAAQRETFPKLTDLLRRHWKAYSSPYEFAPAAGWLFYTCTFVSVMTVVPPMLTEFERAVLVPFMPIASIVSSFTLNAMLLRYLPAIVVVQIGLIGALAFAMTGLWLPLSGWMFIGMFAFMGLVQSASFASIPQLNPSAKSQALANGAMSQMGNLGNLVGTPLMFALLSGFGVTSIYVMLIGCYGAAFVAHLWLAHLRRTRGRVTA